MTQTSASTFARALAFVGRRIEPLFRPQAAWERDRLDTIVTEQRAALSEMGKRLERQHLEIDKIKRELHTFSHDDIAELREVQRVVRSLIARVRRGVVFGEQVVRRVVGRNFELHEQKVLDHLERIGRGSQPVIAGPWTGEVGFELIYWMPFVRWAISRYAIDPARVTVVSRGGPQSWYARTGARYVDVFDFYSADEFRQRTAAARKKQRSMRAFDREVLRRVARQVGGPVQLLHPAMMYELVMPAFKHEAPLSQVTNHTHHVKLPRVEDAALAGKLPSDYVAVRFYYSACFPETPENRRVVADTLRALTEWTDVVVLNPGVRPDDHVDAEVLRSPRIHTLDEVMTPSRNLEIQSAVISHARALVGTYGGFSYLAPLCGVPGFAFYSVKNFHLHHLMLAELAFAAVEGGSFTTIDTSQAGLLRQLLPSLVEGAGSTSA